MNIENNRDDIFYSLFSGLSMYPILRPNDEIIVSQNNDQVELGDILFLLDYEEYIAHRIISINGTFFSKGDRSLLREDINFKHRIGKVVGYRRQGKEILWGRDGQILKKMIAKLSIYNSGKNTRILRLLIIVLLCFLNHFSIFLLKVKNLFFSHKKS